MERWRVLHGACLSSIRWPDHFEYEEGVMPLPPLRALLAELSREQRVALGWLAIADVAVWPQLPEASRTGLLATVRATAPDAPLVAAIGPSDRATSPGLMALGHLATFLDSAHHPNIEEAISAAYALQAAVEHIAHVSGRPSRYWEDWLIRVISCAAITTAQAAHTYAVRSMECQLTVPDVFDYEACLREVDYKMLIQAVTPRLGGKLVVTLGGFLDHEPKSRAIHTRFVPDDAAVPVDLYRLGYVFRTKVMGEFLDDFYEGRYDEVVITHATTGETFRYEPL